MKLLYLILIKYFLNKKELEIYIYTHIHIYINIYIYILIKNKKIYNEEL